MTTEPQTQPDDGGPAFPRTGSFDSESDFRDYPDPDTESQDGMSLRAHFAGRAMQSFVLAVTTNKRVADWMERTGEKEDLDNRETLAMMAVETADDLIAELKKKAPAHRSEPATDSPSEEETNRVIAALRTCEAAMNVLLYPKPGASQDTSWANLRAARFSAVQALTEIKTEPPMIAGLSSPDSGPSTAEGVDNGEQGKKS